MTTNRTALLAKIHKVLKKHYKPVVPPSDRTVLEHLLYACLLENARFEAADEAFAKLKEMYFDWNEIRVTTVTEIAEGMAVVPDASGAAQRVKKSLQSVFETNYSFDLEGLKKQNLGKSEKDLEKITGASPFVRAYVTQQALGGHSIPVSKGAIDVLYAVGVISDAEADKGLVPGMERAIPKNKGVEFGSLLQQVAVDLLLSPGSSKLKAILAEIDPEFKDRLAGRHARLEAEAAAAQAAAKERRQEARAAAAVAAREVAAAEAKAAAKAAAKRAGKKGQAGPAKAGPLKPPPAPAKPAPPPPERAAPKPPEKSVSKPSPSPAPHGKKKEEPALPARKDKADKKSSSKGLAKKKPR